MLASSILCPLHWFTYSRRYFLFFLESPGAFTNVAKTRHLVPLISDTNDVYNEEVMLPTNLAAGQTLLFVVVVGIRFSSAPNPTHICATMMVFCLSPLFDDYQKSSQIN
jgi:hypothetical protein